MPPSPPDEIGPEGVADVDQGGSRQIAEPRAPGLSAADQILAACAYGDAELTIGLEARAAVMLNAVAPAWFAHMTALATRILPGPAGPNGDQPKRGRESESKWAPSVATTLTDRAAILNNEL